MIWTVFRVGCTYQFFSVEQFLASENWAKFFEVASDPNGDWTAGISMINHQVAELISLYKESCVPVVSIDNALPWMQGRQEATVARGCHKFALI